MASNDDSSEERQENSATEISTDSEFEHDGKTPTQHEIPEITINDAFVRKTRGQYVEPKKVQIKSRVISPINGNVKQKIEPEPSVTLRKVNILKINDSPRPVSVNPMPLVNPRKGDYLLNRTHSTEGIASKLSLELKKRYLLGGSALGGSVMKSGSTSNVDTKLRNFTDAISQQQKLLNPAPEPSPTMQAFLQGTGILRATPSIPLSPIPSLEMLKSSLKTNKLPDDKPNKSGEYPAVHLPDLIKETNIMKSKTDPNILRTDFTKPIKKNEEKFVEEDEINNKSTNDNKEEIKEEIRIIESNEVNDLCRPRSPLHETSIVVPQVDWKKQAEENKVDNSSSDDSEMDSDSLSSSDLDDNHELDLKNLKLQGTLSPPRLQIHSTEGDLLLDEGGDAGITFEPDSIECVLNASLDEEQPKLSEQSSSRPIDLWSRSSNDTNKNAAIEIETINNNLQRLDLKDDNRTNYSNCSSPTSVASTLSNKENDSVENDVTTAALTETELSEWARDGEGFVAADLRDTGYDLNTRINSTSKRLLRGNARIAKEEDLTDIESMSEEILNKIDTTIDIPSNDTWKLLANGENIDYMDTDNESLLDSLRDATNVPLVKNRGYVEFVNVAGMSSSPVRESRVPFVDAPIAAAEPEPELCSDDDRYDAHVIQINPVTMDDIKDRLIIASNKSKAQDNQLIVRGREENVVIEAVNREIIHSMDEDSLLVIEPAEDTTTSELTTILASPVCCPMPEIVAETKITVEPSKNESTDANHPDYLEYVKRLQSRIAEFSNVKDSIDVRKSKRKNSKSTLQDRSAEMIVEEIKCHETLNTSFNSPATSRKLEEITRERSKQKTLIQDLLMDKIEAHKQKSAEKKAKRAARTTSFNANSQLFSPKPNVPPTTNITTPIAHSPLGFTPTNSPIRTTFAEAKKSLDSPNIEKRSLNDKQSFEYSNNDFRKKSLQNINTEEQVINNEAFKTPIAPPRLKHEEARRTAEKAKLEARERARLKSDEDLGLSPEDKIRLLRMKVAKRQLSMEDRRRCDDEILPDVKTRHYSFTFNKTRNTLQPSKSTDNVKAIAKKMTLDLLPPSTAKSMDQLAHSGKDHDVKSPIDSVVKRDKKKSKDPERRRSIIQAVSDFFKKKEATPSPTSQKDKGSVFRLASRSKEKVKVKIIKIL